MTYEQDSGYFNAPDGTSFSYGCTTGASTTQAIGSMTVGRTFNLAASLAANIDFQGVNYRNTDNELILGTQVSVSTTNVYSGNPMIVGDIMYATATYSVSTLLSVNQKVPKS